MRLFRAEWRRLFARRLTRIMIVLILVVLGAVAVGVTFYSHPITAADHAAARRQVAEQLKFYEQAKADCQAARSRGEDISQRFPPNCDMGTPQIEEQEFLPFQFDFSRELSAILLVGAGVLALFGFVVGASFVGAEWSSGGMTNLLLWRPRRLLVLGTKLVAMLTGVLLVAAAYLGAWVGTFWLVAKYRGALGKLTTGWWESLALTGARAAALGLVAAAAGFALASLGRHTAMALGAGIGYAIVVDIGSLIIFSLFNLRNAERYRLSTYVVAWLIKKYEVAGDVTSVCGPLGCTPPKTYVITWGMSAGVIGAIMVMLVVAAFLAIRRRDIT